MLVRIRPRPDTLHISRGHTVLATDRDGLVLGEPHGLFVRETRVLSRLRYLIDGEPPRPNVRSNVEKHSFLGYYIAAALDCGGAALRADPQRRLRPPHSYIETANPSVHATLTQAAYDPNALRLDDTVAAGLPVCIRTRR